MKQHKPPNLNQPLWLDEDDPDLLGIDQPRGHRAPEAPALVFAPLAWLKLQFFLHAGDTEIGGFGISSAHDLLYIEDFLTVRQLATPVSVNFVDDAVADYTDACVDAGLQPQQFLRIWCHTHPGESPNPSCVDEQTYSRVFGTCDWSVMFIIGRTGKTYARLSFSAGPAGNILLPVSVDWETWPTVAIHHLETLTGLTADWIAEYAADIKRQTFEPVRIGADDPGADEIIDSLDQFGPVLPEPRQPTVGEQKLEVAV